MDAVVWSIKYAVVFYSCARAPPKQGAKLMFGGTVFVRVHGTFLLTQHWAYCTPHRALAFARQSNHNNPELSAFYLDTRMCFVLAGGTSRFSGAPWVGAFAHVQHVDAGNMSAGLLSLLSPVRREMPSHILWTFVCVCNVVWAVVCGLVKRFDCFSCSCSCWWCRADAPCSMCRRRDNIVTTLKKQPNNPTPPSIM